MPKISLSRRQFIKHSLSVTGALQLPISLSACNSEAPAFIQEGHLYPNGRLSLSPDGKLSVYLDKVEMGQGIATGLLTLVAEELDIAPKHITWLNNSTGFPQGNPYFKPSWGTGASNSLLTNWYSLRQTCANFRALLCEAAAKHWNIDATSCRCQNGYIIHKDEKISWQELIPYTTHIATPIGTIKSPPFKYIGKPTPRVDSYSKITGTARYGIDQETPHQLIAMIARGAQISDQYINSEGKVTLPEELAIPKGVQLRKLNDDIAIIGLDTWSVIKVRRQLQDLLSPTSSSTFSSELLNKQFANISATSGQLAQLKGFSPLSIEEQSNSQVLLSTLTPKTSHQTVIKQEYQLPFLAHATMEPMNCTANVTETHCTVWAPTQRAPLAQQAAQEITGLPLDKITVHTTLIGGGFGRRLQQDYVTEAVALSQIIKKPVKVIWSREDDMQYSPMRPATTHRIAAKINEDGHISHWAHQILHPGPARDNNREKVLQRLKHKLLWAPVINEVTEGAADIPYNIPNIEVAFQQTPIPSKTSAWRSIGHSHNAFVVESFIDELAMAVKLDPLQLRLQLLGEHPRHQEVLKLAANKSGWKAFAHQGCAVHESYGSVVAEIVELEASSNSQAWSIKRVTCAVDCGQVVNPNIVKDQVISGVIFGLSAALYGKISYHEGLVQQSNFHDYPVLRMDETPEIEVHIIPSSNSPTGIGEPGLPPIAAALNNAIASFTGQRYRTLPILNVT